MESDPIVLPGEMVDVYGAGFGPERCAVVSVDEDGARVDVVFAGAMSAAALKASRAGTGEAADFVGVRMVERVPETIAPGSTVAVWVG